MAEVKQAHVGDLKKGSYVVIEGIASQVTDTQVSRPGKHGHAKVRLTAAGLIDKKKRVIVMPGHDNIDVPIIEKRQPKSYPLQAIQQMLWTRQHMKHLTLRSQGI